MKKILLITIIFFVSFGTYAQELAADDFVTITQENAAYPGFNAKTYRGLFSVGHGQFKMFNYGGTPGNLTALGANETLGSFVFNGYDGSSNVISAVIQAKTITGSRDPRFNFLLSNGVGNQRPNRMTIVGQTGNVGIGITDPTERLDVNGNIRMRTGATAGYIPVSDADGKMTWTDPSTIISASPWTDGGTAIYTTSANVGIGTNFPQSPLSIESSGQLITLTSSTSQNYIAFYDSQNSVGYVGMNNGSDNMDIGTVLGNGVGNTNLVTGGIPRLTIDSDGYVGIGTTNLTEAQLSIETNTTSTIGAIKATVNYVGSVDLPAINTISTPANGYGYGIQSTGGYIGVLGALSGGDYSGSAFGVIGTAKGNIGARYSIYGNDPFIYGSPSVGYAGYFAGNVTVTGTFTNPSDRKLKQNVESYTDALEVINQLEAKTYDYKKGEFAKMGLPSQPQIGFIAQEVEKVLPNLVTANVHPEEIEHDEAGNRTIIREAIDYKGINYIGLIPVLTQGIKELSAENQELKSSLADVTKQLSELTELMNDKFNQMEEDMSSCCLNETDSRTGSTNTNIELNSSDIPSLEQNNPNPFYEQTVIKYYIPSAARSATMTITDIKGSPIKSVNLASTGLGTVTINANELPIGTYIYTLFVDGKQVESKQMILIK